MQSEREVMSVLPSKTVSVQIKLDLWRPGTFNYPKYSNPKYHQRHGLLTSGRINGGLIKFLSQMTAKAKMALLLHELYMHVYNDDKFLSLNIDLIYLMITIIAYNNELTGNLKIHNDCTFHLIILLPIF